MLRRILPLGVAAGVLAAAGLGGCGDDASPRPGSQWARAVAGLCAAAEEVRAGDVDAAEATFFDRAHDALHELADETTGEDRAAAAALLRAKEAVESGFADSSPALADDLDALVSATRAAVGATGAPVPAGCS